MLHQHRVILAHQFIARVFRRRFIAAGGEIILNLAENPRIRRRRAADHHRIASGFADHANGVFRRNDVAVADHRNLHRGFYFRDAGPIGMPAIALLARARMQRDRLNSAILGQPRHLHRDQFAIVPAGAELHGERNRDRGAHGFAE